MTAFVVPVTARVSRHRRQFNAFASALSLEVLLIGAGLFWLKTHPPQPVDVITPLTIEVASPPEPEKLSTPEMAKPPPPPPTTSAVKPPPVLQPKLIPVTAASSPATPVAMTTPLPAPASAPSMVPEPSVSLPAAVAAPTVAPQPVPAPVPTPAPAPASPPSIDLSPAYNAKLAAAVQVVFEVPAAAADLNFKGRTRVEFNLRDGVVSKVRVLQTSGLGVADRAAVKAVQAAIYPAPPAQLQGKEGTYQIWVACM
jgi:periplasmic protein TonB